MKAEVSNIGENAGPITTGRREGTDGEVKIRFPSVALRNPAQAVGNKELNQSFDYLSAKRNSNCSRCLSRSVILRTSQQSHGVSTCSLSLKSSAPLP